MKIFKNSNSHKTAPSVLVALTTVLTFGFVTTAFTATPGSDDDPIVTKSYVDAAIKSLKSELQELISNGTSSSNNSSSENGNSQNNQEYEYETIKTDGFEVVNMKQAQVLKCLANTELVVRTGVAKAVSLNESGLSDLTKGADIKSGEQVEANHLLLVPRTDGRGLAFETDSIVLVSGEYYIVESEVE